MNYAIFNDTGNEFCISYNVSKNEISDINRIMKIVQILRAMEIIEQHDEWLNKGKAIRINTTNGIKVEEIDD